jgi:tetratricopeptide (TPR) repeat protein
MTFSDAERHSIAQVYPQHVAVCKSIDRAALAVEESVVSTGEGLSYPPCTVTLVKFLGLGLGVLLCAATAAGQTSKSGSETMQPTQSVREPAPRNVPNDEAITAYEEGQAAYKRKEMAHAAQAFESAVKIDPQMEIAWRDLGRARMSLRQPVQAEAAFRKFLELSPDDPNALANLAWALTAEKKYNEAIDVLRKQLDIDPDVGDVYQRIGDAYMQMNQPEHAIPELKKAVSLSPNNWGPHHQLGQAYMRTHEYDNAAASYERAFAINPMIGWMNDAAFELAASQTHLDLADKWATYIVQNVELELSQVKMPLDSLTLQRGSALAGFWDTLGWVKFQKGDLAAAEKYVGAAAQFVADPGGYEHLGEIYEAQGRTTDAAEAYAEVLGLVPATRELNDDEKKARKQLATLLGSESLIEVRVKKARAKMEDRRGIQIPNAARVLGLVQYVVIIGPGSRVTEMQAMSSDDPLAELKDAVRSAKVPQAFPDDTTQKLPRTITLSCPR